MQEPLVQSLGQEDPLEKEMATHSSILTWEIPWTEQAGGLQSMRSQESDTTVNHLEWVAYPFSSGSSQPRNQTAVFCIAGRLFTN